MENERKNVCNSLKTNYENEQTLIGRPTQRSSKTISFIAKSSRSWAMNWMIFTKMLSGVSRGTTALDPRGNNELTMLWRRECVAEFDSHLIRIM